MNKKLLVKLCAITSAVAVGTVPCITALAMDPIRINDGSEQVIDGDVDITAYRLEDEEANFEYPTAIRVTDSSSLEINGDVSFTSKPDEDGYSEYAYGIRTYSNGSVVVNGDVIFDDEDGWATPVVVSGNGKVQISGDVIDKADTVPAIQHNGKGKVAVGGNVTAEGMGLITRNFSDLNVKGDVSAVDNAIEIDVYDKNASGQVIVEGKIKSTNGSIISFVSHKQAFEDAGGAAGLAGWAPKIVLYQIDESNKDSIAEAHVMTDYDEATRQWGYMSEEDQKAIADSLLTAVNYIIHTEGDIQLSGDSLGTAGENGELKTMKHGETIKATVANGYLVEGSDTVTVTKVADGEYNVTLDSRLGGITLKAVVDKSNSGNSNNNNQQTDNRGQQQNNNRQQARQTSANNSESSDNSQQSSTSDTSAVQTITISLTAIDSSTPASGDSTTAKTTSVSDGATPAKTVSVTVEGTSPEQYQTAVVNNISSTPAGETLRIETDEVSCLDKTMLEAFAEKGDIDLEVVFTYNGQKLRVVIPKGTDITKLLDEKGFCGFLRLADILGAQAL